MKQKLMFGLLLLLLAGCTSQPSIVDNGHPGQINVIVFYDDNKNGVMDNGESGAPQQVAITQEVTCTPANPNFIKTDTSGVIVFKSLQPGRYCIFIDNGYGMTTKMSQDVYLSSDQIAVTMFGVVRP